MLPVEVWHVPPLRLSDVHAQPDPSTGVVKLTVTVRNDKPALVSVALRASVSPRLSGKPVADSTLRIKAAPGFSTHRLELAVPLHRLWNLDDPQLYNLAVQAGSCERLLRIGFRDFRIQDGWFVLNGKRLFLKSTHTANHVPIGQIVPPDPDLVRRDMLYAKACGFNCVRFIAGLAWPEQLDLCDEIGLMVYEECAAAWKPMMDSPDMARRYDRSVTGMIRRDRNHPCITIWGMLKRNPGRPRLSPCGPGSPACPGSGSRPPGPALQRALGHRSVCRPPSPIRTAVNGNAPGEGSRRTPRRKSTGGQTPTVSGTSTFTRSRPMRPTRKSCSAHWDGGTKPVFLSEYGIGSQMNVVGELRKYEEAGARPDLFDHALVRSQVEKLQADWRRWDFDGVYPFPEDMLRDSQRLHARQRRMGFDLVRSNPQFCGFNLTGMLDHVMTGEGLWTFWRELKPLIAETLRDGWAPLRWCLFVDPPARLFRPALYGGGGPGQRRCPAAGRISGDLPDPRRTGSRLGTPPAPAHSRTAGGRQAAPRRAGAQDPGHAARSIRSLHLRGVPGEGRLPGGRSNCLPLGRRT